MGRAGGAGSLRLQGAQATAVKHLGADGGEAVDVTFDFSGSYIGFAAGNAIRVWRLGCVKGRGRWGGVGCSVPVAVLVTGGVAVRVAVRVTTGSDEVRRRVHLVAPSRRVATRGDEGRRCWMPPLLENACCVSRRRR
jgi:hypothetical protein